ncbi:DUF502 domain-containing protein [Halorientalis salina]|uniref:DUF502 domain-containing protein n=1 Tax=Halorientalis salina TaxID=2932266 RepID=UPI00145DBA63|nr:DUF502 domain-containing protein [Halorientalis salina]
MEQDSETYGNLRLSIRDYLRKSVITGTAIVLPVLITAVLFLFIVNFLSQLLNPLVIPIQEGPGDTSPFVSKLIAIVVLFGIIFFVGAFTESRVGGDRLKRNLDATMAQIPGIRSIYSPLDQISTMLLEGDTQNFQDVLLVEYPKEGSYSVAFQTSTPPEMIEQTTEEDDMLTVFLPMGPNPFMGGFILHMSEDEVYPLDLSVEEGVSSIISFGVAVEIDDHPPDVPIDLDKVTKDDA